MKDKAGLKSVEKVTVFAKTPPKAVKVKGGYIYEFTDVLSMLNQKEVHATNVSINDIKKFCDIKNRLSASSNGVQEEPQMEFPF